MMLLCWNFYSKNLQKKTVFIYSSRLKSSNLFSHAKRSRISTYLNYRFMRDSCHCFMRDSRDHRACRTTYPWYTGWGDRWSLCRWTPCDKYDSFDMDFHGVSFYRCRYSLYSYPYKRASSSSSIWSRCDRKTRWFSHECTDWKENCSKVSPTCLMILRIYFSRKYIWSYIWLDQSLISSDACVPSSDQLRYEYDCRTRSDHYPRRTDDRYRKKMILPSFWALYF